MNNSGDFPPPREYEVEELENLPSDPDPPKPEASVEDNRRFDVDGLPTDLSPSKLNLTRESPVNLQEQLEYPRPTESSGAPKVLRIEKNNSGPSSSGTSPQYFGLESTGPMPAPMHRPPETISEPSFNSAEDVLYNLELERRTDFYNNTNPDRSQSVIPPVVPRNPY